MALILKTESEILLELGQRLREHRLRKNLPQKELASRTGMSASVLKKMEASGKGSMENFIKIVFALRLESELNDLFQLPAQSIAQVEALRLPARQRARRSSGKI